jgi:hypothetical protein
MSYDEKSMMPCGCRTSVPHRMRDSHKSTSSYFFSMKGGETVATVVKVVFHPESGKYVVNMPGSGMRPRVFTSRDKAMALVSRLTP